MNADRNGSVAALDIGSAKICCFIATDEGEGVMRVLGVGHRVTRGLRGGAIIDMDAAEEAVRDAVHAAETAAGEVARSAVLNFSGGRLHSKRFGVSVELAGREVGDGEVEQANGQAQRYAPPDDHDLLHLAPVAYALDGTEGIHEPRGLFGERLVAEFHAVGAPRGPLRTLRACAARCHLDVRAVLPAAYASASAALVEDEMAMGAVCIDMGAGTTDIAAFHGGAPVFADSVPMGGAQVTDDLAYGLSTAPAVAERIKTMHASVIAGGDDDRELIDVPELGEAADAGFYHVPRSRLIEIVRPRLEETFALVRDRLEAAGLDAAASRRIVLCGGASALNGVSEVAARVLGRSVRLGRPRQLRGLTDTTAGAAFATCAGLALAAGAGESEAIAGATRPAERPPTRLGRVGRWLRENF